MSGSKTAMTNKKQKRNATKPAAKPFKRAASIVELHAYPGRLMLVSLVGKMGHPARALAQFDDIKLVGALEDGGDMRDIVLQTGMAVLATLTKYPIGTAGSSVRGLMAALVQLAGIDVEAVRKEAATEDEALRREAILDQEQAEMLRLEAAQDEAVEHNADAFDDEVTVARELAGPTQLAFDFGGES